MNIKKSSIVPHHVPPHLSDTDAAWLKIVYAGCALAALSLVFHVWLFFSAGKVTPLSPSLTSASVENTIDRAELNALISNYTARQNEAAADAQADAALADPSK